MYRQSANCEEEHSWAWITPEGEFIEVDNHGDWAKTNFPQEVIRRVLESSYKDAPTPEVARALVEMEVREGFSVLHKSNTPNHLLEKSKVYTIPEKDRKEAKKLDLPTLSLGVWGAKTRLTRQEEAFLLDFDVYPDLIEVVRESKRNQQIRDYWEKEKRRVWMETTSAANDYLMDLGWIKVANAYELGGSRIPSKVQWESFFREVLQCWKQDSLYPPVEKELFSLSYGSAHDEIPLEEVIERYCPRRLQDEIYEHLLGGRASRPWQDRYKQRLDELNAQSYLREEKEIERVQKTYPKNQGLNRHYLENQNRRGKKDTRTDQVYCGSQSDIY